MCISEVELVVATVRGRGLSPTKSWCTLNGFVEHLGLIKPGEPVEHEHVDPVKPALPWNL